MPTKRRCARWVTRLRTSTCICFTALTGSTHQHTRTSKAPRRWLMVVVPCACCTWYTTSPAPQAEGARLQHCRVRRSCSSNHSDGGYATASLDHTVSWLSRMFSAQVLPAPDSDTSAPSWALANTLTQGRSGRSPVDTSKPKVPVRTAALATRPHRPHLPGPVARPWPAQSEAKTPRPHRAVPSPTWLRSAISPSNVGRAQHIGGPTLARLCDWPSARHKFARVQASAGGPAAHLAAWKGPRPYRRR